MAVAVSGGSGVHAYGSPHKPICTPVQGPQRSTCTPPAPVTKRKPPRCPLASPRTSRSVDKHHACTRRWQAPTGLTTCVLHVVDGDVSQCLQHGQVLEGALLQRHDGVVVQISARVAPAHSSTVRYTHAWATPARPATTMHTGPRDLSLMTHCAHARRRLRT